MPIPNDLSPDLRSLIQGDPWGRGWPAKQNPPPLAVDGRTVALKLLRRYLSELSFYRTGALGVDGKFGAAVPFKIPKESIHIGWPDYEQEMQFPSVVLLHQPGNYNAIGLNNYVQEETHNRYAPNTVVQWMSEYQENVILEIWANKRAELRSLLAGIEVALSPTETMYGLRFRMPDYYDQLVCFTPGPRTEFDEPDSARNRRRARIEVEMRYTVVALVGVEFPIQAAVQLQVDVDPDYNTSVVVDVGDADACR